MANRVGLLLIPYRTKDLAKHSGIESSNISRMKYREMYLHGATIQKLAYAIAKIKYGIATEKRVAQIEHDLAVAVAAELSDRKNAKSA